MRRNCWTCKHDEKDAQGGYHVCTADWRVSGTEEWIAAHVAPPSPGVPASMPPKDAPPCPAWVPRTGGAA
jgi:hypothetical protein